MRRAPTWMRWKPRLDLNQGQILLVGVPLSHGANREGNLMPTRETLKLHAGLVDDMAMSLGVDLEEAAIGGQLTIDDLTDAVLRCTGCANPAHCQASLQDSNDTRQTPEYCRNRTLLHKLIS